MNTQIPVLQLAAVSKTFSDGQTKVPVLHDVSLSVQSGQSTAIVGRSGSGKTTMLMIAAGLESATTGTVSWGHRDVTTLNEDDLARHRREWLGIVFQGFHLIPNMTALENVAVSLEIAGIADAFDRAEEALNKVDLSHRLGSYPATLSGGEQQRVAVARAFANGPKLILADEPTGNLDTASANMVMDILHRTCADYGAGLLLITHDKALARDCHVVQTMNDGVLTVQADPQNDSPEVQQSPQQNTL